MIKLNRYNLALSFLIITSILLFSTSSLAAERVVLKYRILRQSVSVKDLSTFAETGKLPLALQASLALAKQDPKPVRQYLTQPVNVNPVLLDKVLNSPVGNVFLDQISQVIHTPSRTADRQAMRSALVLSASKDKQISLIEVIQNYPSTDVEVDGNKLESAYKQLRRLQGNIQDFLRI